MMMGLAHTLLVENLHDQGFLDRYTVGFDRVRQDLLGEDDGVAKDADWAGDICGVDPETIRRLARRMAQGRTMIGCASGLQRAD